MIPAEGGWQQRPAQGTQPPDLSKRHKWVFALPVMGCLTLLVYIVLSVLADLWGTVEYRDETLGFSIQLPKQWERTSQFNDRLEDDAESTTCWISTETGEILFVCDFGEASEAETLGEIDSYSNSDLAKIRELVGVSDQAEVTIPRKLQLEGIHGLELEIKETRRSVDVQIRCRLVYDRGKVFGIYIGGTAEWFEFNEFMYKRVLDSFQALESTT